jgi:hypothetical protein
MNREDELNKTFPLEDGTTYIQNMDKSLICEYSGLPSTQSYVTNPQTQAEGAGVGGESFKENFIDSASLKQGESEEQDKLDKIYEKLDRDYMYNWIRKHSNK